MNELESILRQLQETDAASGQMRQMLEGDPSNDMLLINADAIAKRRSDLERRLNSQLHAGQVDLVAYHVERRGEQRYPALAVASAVAGFQELVTAVFDALRTTPKQRYKPSAESVELSTLDFSMALPTGSVVVSMSVDNERLIAVKSELDRTFDQVFAILDTKNSEELREIASTVGIAAIAKAHDWAESAAKYGLSTHITIQKDQDTKTDFTISDAQALHLKETIEEKSDKRQDQYSVEGELIGIDVDVSKSYFHLKMADGKGIEGRLSSTFDKSREWVVHVHYAAELVMLTTIKYATGDEKVEWELASLTPIQTDQTA